MALATANDAADGMSSLSQLTTELSALQDAILGGSRPQYKLPAATITRLRYAVNDLESLKRLAPQDEGQRKRQRIEGVIQEQVEQQQRGDKDTRTGVIDVDGILTKAQALCAPVSGLKVQEDDKSSFDENDYYSSQVESKWSEDETKPFTADFEGFAPAAKKRATDTAVAAKADNSDDEYIPDEPGNDQEYIPGGGDDPSDYEPGEVSQMSDDYVPDYAPPAMSDAEPRHKVKNHLTQIAAPQPNRISPMAMHKSYELELVNGRPEMVRKKKYETDARQSSASPPVTRNRKKSKKRKREAEQIPQMRQPKKRSQRDAGLDTSAQYPLGYKTETKLAVPTYSTAGLRSASVVQPSRRDGQDLRRVATLHTQTRPEYTPYSPAVPYAPAQPPIYRQPTVAPLAPPPHISDGLRYYHVEQPPIPAPDARYDRAPSRMSQYDPNNARIEYPQSARPTAATPAYHDPRMPKLRGPPEYEQGQPMYARPFVVPEYAYANRQESVASAQYYRQAPEPLRAAPLPYGDPQAYGAVREGLQVPQYPPAGPPPLQPPYGMPQDPNVRYVDARGYEIPPQMRPVTEYRQY